MKINIYSIGKIKQSSPEHSLILEYQKRLPWSLKIHEFQEIRSNNINESKEREAELLLSKLESGFVNIALDENGKEYSSTGFAKLIKDKCKINFIIGGAFGHGSNILNNPNILKFSLSKMTLPHLFARAMLVEQIYRSYTIISNHPYHKI